MAGSWPELRALVAARPGPWCAIRGPWAVALAALDQVAVDLVRELRALVPATWCAIRGPSTWCRWPWPVLPGARPGGQAPAPGRVPAGDRRELRGPRPRPRDSRPVCEARRPWPDFAQSFTS